MTSLLFSSTIHRQDNSPDHFQVQQKQTQFPLHQSSQIQPNSVFEIQQKNSNKFQYQPNSLFDFQQQDLNKFQIQQSPEFEIQPRSSNKFHSNRPFKSKKMPNLEGTRIYVGNLPKDVNPDELNDMFARYGKVNNVWVAKKPPGFAFVYMHDDRDADDAVYGLDGKKVFGARIKVEIAHGKKRRSSNYRRNSSHRESYRRYSRDRDYRRRNRSRSRSPIKSRSVTPKLSEDNHNNRSYIPKYSDEDNLNEQSYTPKYSDEEEHCKRSYTPKYSDEEHNEKNSYTPKYNDENYRDNRSYSPKYEDYAKSSKYTHDGQRSRSRTPTPTP